MAKQGRGLITAVVLAICAATFFMGRWSSSSTPNASDGSPRFVTAQIQRRYIESSVEVNGTIVSGSTTRLTLVAPEGVARAIITATPVPQGAVVKAGTVIAEASGRPVILLPGAVPAYRDLKVGDKGSDVRQLQSALRDVGLHPDQNGVIGSLTVAAVESLYQSIGYPMPEGGLIRASELMFAARLPGRLASPATSIGTAIADQTVVVVSGLAEVQLKLPQGAVPPSKGDSVDLSCSSTPITGVVATVSIPGAAVDSASSADAEAPGAQTVVRVSSSKVIPNELLDASCVGTVVKRLTENMVLAVPSSAVFSTSDGGSSLQIAEAAGATLNIPVTLGASADGWIELTNPPAAAAEGADVVVGTSS